MNLELLRWIWRICFVGLLLSMCVNNLNWLQLFLMAAIIGIRVYIVHNDKTVY